MTDPKPNPNPNPDQVDDAATSLRCEDFTMAPGDVTLPSYHPYFTMAPGDVRYMPLTLVVVAWRPATCATCP